VTIGYLLGCKLLDELVEAVWYLWFVGLGEVFERTAGLILDLI